jgi:hypothetical protein
VALRDRAEKDMATIVQGYPSGWRWPVEITDPLGNTSVGMYGITNDVSLFIDPSTGLPISGRQASVACRIAEFANQGLVGFPQAINNDKETPWVVKFNDINGVPHTFKHYIANNYPKN